MWARFPAVYGYYCEFNFMEEADTNKSFSCFLFFIPFHELSQRFSAFSNSQTGKTATVFPATDFLPVKCGNLTIINISVKF